MNNRIDRFAAAGEWLVRLREDTVTESEISEWARWCEADAANLKAFEEVQALWQGAREHRPAPEIVARLMQADRQPPLKRWLPAAASVAAIGIAIAGFLELTKQPEGIRRLANVELLHTRIAENQQALLPDGSRVDIAARTTLDVAFTAASRHLKLQDGQAFFKVRHDKNRPFIVDAGDIQIRAIGTAFDVRRSPAQITVTVQEGVIEVTTESKILRSAAGEQLVFDRRSKAVSQSSVDTEVPLAWRSGRLEFTGDPLSTVVASANRYSARRIVLADAELEGLIFTGTVFTASIEASLDALEQVFPIEVERMGNDIVLRARR